MRAVGATTLDEYRKYIEKDAALDRRFQPVTVREPNVADTIDILGASESGYEATTGPIRDAALSPPLASPAATSPTAASPIRRST